MHDQDKSRLGQPRMIVVFVLLALLVTSSYINYLSGMKNSEVSSTLPVVRVLTQAPSATLATSATPMPNEQTQTFADFAADRANSRAQEIEMLDSIISDSSSTQQIVTQAQEQKLAIVESMEKESGLESLLKARGFDKTLVYVTGSSVTVVIAQQELTQTQLTQILDLAVRETGAKAENIKIIARK